MADTKPELPAANRENEPSSSATEPASTTAPPTASADHEEEVETASLVSVGEPSETLMMMAAKKVFTLRKPTTEIRPLRRTASNRMSHLDTRSRKRC